MSNQEKNQNTRTPFWMPWGNLGCLWRSIVFMLGMILISLLLGLLMRGCEDGGSNGGRDSDIDIFDPFNPFDPSNPFNPSNPRSPFNDDEEDPGHDDPLYEDPYADLPEELRESLPVNEWIDSIPGIEELPDPVDNYIPPVDSTRVVVNPEDSTSQIICDQLTVFFNSNDLKKDMGTFARRFKELYPGNGYEVIYYNPIAGTMLLAVPSERLMEVAEELPQKITGIDFVVATNEIMSQTAILPSDPAFSKPDYDRYFKLIQAYEAWEVTKGSPDVKVAIVDSYFDLSNPELAQRHVNRIHIPSKTNNVLPPAKAPTVNDLTAYCHGSHVAGIAIGAQDNGVGCSGIAPECSWIPVSLGSQLTSFNIMEGILYAVNVGADVVNFSVGRQFHPLTKIMPLEEQVRRSVNNDTMGEKLWEYIIKVANDRNCVLCTSAGNETVLMGLDPKNRSNGLIKVEAVDNNGRMADFSNFGTVPEADINYSTIAAPGVNLWSVSDKRCAALWKSQGYVVSQKEGLQEMSGTSMASPVVAGAVALLKSKNKDLTTEQVIKILKMTAKQTDTEHRIGPTIQIRDALDATGGELMNFDDLMKNHDLIIGKWKSTHELNLTDVQTRQKRDDMWTYFIFTSPDNGFLEYHTINSKLVYRANLRVEWGTSSVTITQEDVAVAPNGDTVTKAKFVCTPDKDRMLEAECTTSTDQFTFKLEKVN